MCSQGLAYKRRSDMHLKELEYLAHFALLLIKFCRFRLLLARHIHRRAESLLGEQFASHAITPATTPRLGLLFPSESDLILRVGRPQPCAQDARCSGREYTTVVGISLNRAFDCFRFLF